MIAAAGLLDEADPPTAIFAFNDKTAIGGAPGGPLARPARAPGPRARCPRRRQQLPDRLPVADDVREPLAEMGRMAVSLPLRLLEGQLTRGRRTSS